MDFEQKYQKDPGMNRVKDKAALFGKNLHNVRNFKEYTFWGYDYGDIMIVMVMMMIMTQAPSLRNICV